MKFPFTTILVLSTSFIPWTIGLPSPDTLPSNFPIFDISPFPPIHRDLPKTHFVNRYIELSPRQATTSRITNLISVSSAGCPNKQFVVFLLGDSGTKIAVFFINFNAALACNLVMQMTFPPACLSRPTARSRVFGRFESAIQPRPRHHLSYLPTRSIMENASHIRTRFADGESAI